MIAASLGLVIVAVAVFFLFFYQPALTVVPTPSTASVTIDGQGITPGTPVKLAPGRYEVLVEAPEYLSTRVRVTLSASQVLNLPIELRHIPTVATVTGSVAFPALVPDQSAIVYLGRDGRQFFRVDTQVGADGQFAVTPITPERFQDVRAVWWSPDRELAVLQTTAGATSLFDFQRYDFLHQEERPLPDGLRAVAWHPTDTQIIAFRAGTDGERSLVTINIRTGVLERLIDLRNQGFTDPTLAWSPNGRTLSLTENRILLYDVATRTLTPVAGSDGATEARWNATSTVLAFAADGDVKLVGFGDTPIGQPAPHRTTLPKTVWTAAGDGLVVASTTDQEKDRFERINLATGAGTLFRYESDHPIDATNLMLRDENRELWFTSAGTLHRLVLEEEVLDIEN